MSEIKHSRSQELDYMFFLGIGQKLYISINLLSVLYYYIQKLDEAEVITSTGPRKHEQKAK